MLGREPASIGPDAVSKQMAPNFELMTTMAYVAAVTERIKLGIAVQVLTIRNAVLNARQLATVDRYSGGRLVLGVGVGWLKEEADTMNMPWDRRGARAEEHIALLRAIWTAPGDHVEFHGEFWDFPPMDPEPRPVQQPIPILIGGHGEKAIDRAVRLGDGWVAAGVSAGRLAELLPVLLRRRRTSRPRRLHAAHLLPVRRRHGGRPAPLRGPRCPGRPGRHRNLRRPQAVRRRGAAPTPLTRGGCVAVSLRARRSTPRRWSPWLGAGRPSRTGPGAPRRRDRRTRRPGR